MIFPVIVLLGGSVHHSHSEWHLYDFVFLLIGLVAVIHSSRSSGLRWIKWLMWITYGSLAAALLLRSQFHWLEYLAYASSLALISVHVYNMYRGNSCRIPLT